jgi:hypothetical protein
LGPKARDLGGHDQVLAVEQVRRAPGPPGEARVQDLQPLHRRDFWRHRRRAAWRGVGRAIGRGLERRGRERGQGERVIEDPQLVPDRSAEVTTNHRLRLLGHLTGLGPLLGRTEQRELGDEIEHLEEPLSSVGLPVRPLVEGLAGEGLRGLGQPGEGPAPLEDHLLGIGDVVHLDAADVRDVLGVGLERGEAPAGEQREPRLVEQRPGRVDEEPGLRRQAERLPRVRNGRLDRHPPDADRPGEHHEDLRAQGRGGQTLVQPHGQEAELVRGRVVLLDGTHQHGGVERIRVGRLLDVPVSQREADHGRGVHEREGLVTRQEAGRVQIGP